jgi:hypothetical protein
MRESATTPTATTKSKMPSASKANKYFVYKRMDSYFVISTAGFKDVAASY